MKYGFLFDLDGTVYRGNAPIEGAARFFAKLNSHGTPYMFLTNRSNRSSRVVCDHLIQLGIVCGAHQVLTSAMATPTVLRGTTVYCIGEDGLRGVLDSSGIALVEAAPTDVVVGFDREFTYQKLLKANHFIRAGAQFIATNTDEVITTEEGIVPENGPLVAAIATATGISPRIVGKPERAMIDLAGQLLGLPLQNLLMVGDNLTTDIAAAKAAGIRSILLLTGVSQRGDVVSSKFQPDWIARDYEELQDIVDRQLS